MANAGMNPKALQYIMGHASMAMTLNYYANPALDSAKAEMEHISAYHQADFTTFITPFHGQVVSTYDSICKILPDAKKPLSPDISRLGGL